MPIANALNIKQQGIVCINKGSTFGRSITSTGGTVSITNPTPNQTNLEYASGANLTFLGTSGASITAPSPAYLGSTINVEIPGNTYFTYVLVTSSSPVNLQSGKIYVIATPSQVTFNFSYHYITNIVHGIMYVLSLPENTGGWVIKANTYTGSFFSGPVRFESPPNFTTSLNGSVISNAPASARIVAPITASNSSSPRWKGQVFSKSLSSFVFT